MYLTVARALARIAPLEPLITIRTIPIPIEMDRTACPVDEMPANGSRHGPAGGE
jgi:hypothetical protein